MAPSMAPKALMTPAAPTPPTTPLRGWSWLWLLLLLGGSVAADPLAPAAAPLIEPAAPFWTEAPAQLNIPGFASCLAEQSPRFDPEAERKEFALSAADLLLPYLAVYPGKRLLPPVSLLQDAAHERWAVRFEDREQALAERLDRRVAGLAREAVSPGRFFGDAIESCRGSAFCAALISHNVLRTLGRYRQAQYRQPVSGRIRDLNPRWFLSQKTRWIERIPSLQTALMGIRPDGKGDKWGEWYHFFGIFAYALHEIALDPDLEVGGVERVVRLNELLNPVLAGGFEGAEKARLDRDSVAVALQFARPAFPSLAGACDQRHSYVAWTAESRGAEPPIPPNPYPDLPTDPVR